ncbi:unnamed protein product, partial [Hapterophycus canaliculatus]
RPENKGLRLDYFVAASKAAAARGKRGGLKQGTTGAVVVHDCFVLDAATPKLSDHCPVGLTLRLS